MISLKLANPHPFVDKSPTVFEYIDRGYGCSMALVPGWASDHRIFTTLDLKFNYLVPVQFSPFTFEEAFLRELKENNISKVSIFGWSLGGFVASDFASRHKDMVDEVVLVSVRKKYKIEALAEIRKHLKRSKRGYLYKFYNQCFSGKDNANWFKENLLKAYCRELDLGYLLEGLDYLGNVELSPECLNDISKVTIIHGGADQIAPIAEATRVKDNLRHARFVEMDETGHMPFLNRDFTTFI